MDRIFIGLPAEVLERVRDIAARERRSPKQQLEFIIIQAMREQSAAEDREPVGASNA
jgi:hypothetical protein